MRRLVPIAAVFARIGALNEMAYRANFWIQAFESALGMATALATVAIVFNQTDQLGGWHQYELVSLLGIYFILLGALNLVIAPSLNQFMEHVVDGRLDFTLTKPVDAQLLVSISEFRIWKLLDIVLGALLIGIGTAASAIDTGMIEALLFAVTLLTAGVIIYSFWIILATLAFWFIRIENITMIFWSMYTAGRWPVTIYPAWLKWLLTAVVPIAFAVTVPAEALSGRLTLNTLLSSVILAAVLLAGSRWFWRTGIRQYSGASS